VLELNAWCDLHKTRIFLVSERGVPKITMHIENVQNTVTGVSFQNMQDLSFFKTKLNIHTHIYKDKKMNKQLYKTQNNSKKAFKWYVNSKSYTLTINESRS
jgi:glycogen synthase